MFHAEYVTKPVRKLVRGRRSQVPRASTLDLFTKYTSKPLAVLHQHAEPEVLRRMVSPLFNDPSHGSFTSAFPKEKRTGWRSSCVSDVADHSQQQPSLSQSGHLASRPTPAGPKYRVHADNFSQSDNNSKILLYQCRNCAYAENASSDPGMAPCVYRNDLLTVARSVALSQTGRDPLLIRCAAHREQAGETKDLETDPTLQRSNIQCPVCFKNG